MPVDPGVPLPPNPISGGDPDGGSTAAVAVKAPLPSNPLFGGKPTGPFPANPVLSPPPMTPPAVPVAPAPHVAPNPFPVTHIAPPVNTQPMATTATPATHPADSIYAKGGQLASAALARGFRSTDRLIPRNPGEKPIGSFPTPAGLQYVYRDQTVSNPSESDLIYRQETGAKLGGQTFGDILAKAPKLSPAVRTGADILGSLIPGPQTAQDLIRGKYGAAVASAALWLPPGRIGEAVFEAARLAKMAAETGTTLPKALSAVRAVPERAQVAELITSTAATKKEAATTQKLLDHGAAADLLRGGSPAKYWSDIHNHVSNQAQHGNAGGEGFPQSGLSEAEANAIKTAARSKAQAPEQYQAMIRSVSEQELGRKPTALDLKLVEEKMHAAAEANPTAPVSIRFKQLFDNAHAELQARTPQPEDVFGHSPTTPEAAVPPPHSGLKQFLADETGSVGFGHEYVRSPEEAHAHLLEAAAQARAEGFGGGVGGRGNPPLIPTEPAVPEGTVRLYRGEGSGQPGIAGAHGGAWYTTDAEYARQYAHNGRLLYVDVSQEEALKYAQGHLKHYGNGPLDPASSGEFLLPPGHTAKAKPVDWVTPETGGELGQRIREAMPHAPAVRSVQKAGYSPERAARVSAASEASQQAGGGMPGHIAAKAHLEGELPKEFFGHLKDLTPEELHQAALHVDQAPLQFFEKTHVKDALAAAVNHGIVPTKGDQALIERVFGQVAGAANEEQTTAQRFWQKFSSALNIPRALRSATDLGSAGFRQSLVTLVTHPAIFWRNWVKTFPAVVSPKFYDEWMQKTVYDNPMYPLMHKYGVPFTEHGTTLQSVPIGHTEESYIGANAAQHLNLREVPGLHGLGKLGTGPGDLVSATGRGFVGFQNAVRAELFTQLAHTATMLGRDSLDEVIPGHLGERLSLGQSIARVAGTFTGRGVMPKVVEKRFVTLTSTMFSPRLMASRLNLLSPVYYAKLDPFARAEALKGARNLVVAVGTMLYVAKLLGANTTLDPRSSNFGKIKVGNTRVDLTGGFNQYIRLGAQEITRTEISSAGHRAHVGWGQHDVSDLTNLTKLLRSKQAPVTGFLWDELSGKNFIGQPVKQSDELRGMLVPFAFDDAERANKLSGPGAAIAAAFLSALGLSVQTYKDKPATGGGGGGGSGYSGGGSYGGGSSYGSGGGYGGGGAYGP